MDAKLEVQQIHKKQILLRAQRQKMQQHTQALQAQFESSLGMSMASLTQKLAIRPVMAKEDKEKAEREMHKLLAKHATAKPKRPPRNRVMI